MAPVLPLVQLVRHQRAIGGEFGVTLLPCSSLHRPPPTPLTPFTPDTVTPGIAVGPNNTLFKATTHSLQSITFTKGPQIYKL